jgi:hypothetical protein
MLPIAENDDCSLLDNGVHIVFVLYGTGYGTERQNISGRKGFLGISFVLEGFTVRFECELQDHELG